MDSGTWKKFKLSHNIMDMKHVSIAGPWTGIFLSKNQTSREDIILWSALCNTHNNEVEEMQSLLGAPIRCQRPTEFIRTPNKYWGVGKMLFGEVGGDVLSS